MTNAAGQTMTVRGESLGGGKIRISRINQVDVDFTGEYSTVIAIHKDTPGVVAHITSCLASENINIAFMKLFREEKGQTAYSIVESDDALPDSVSELIRKNPSVQDVMLVHKDQPVLTAYADSSSPEESDCLEPVDFKNARELLALCKKKQLQYFRYYVSEGGLPVWTVWAGNPFPHEKGLENYGGIRDCPHYLSPKVYRRADWR